MERIKVCMTRFIMDLRSLMIHCYEFDLDTANGFIKDYSMEDGVRIQKRLRKVGFCEEGSDNHDLPGKTKLNI